LQLKGGSDTKVNTQRAMEPQTNASCWAQIKWQANTPKEQGEGRRTKDEALDALEGPMANQLPTQRSLLANIKMRIFMLADIRASHFATTTFPLQA